MFGHERRGRAPGPSCLHPYAFSRQPRGAPRLPGPGFHPATSCSRIFLGVTLSLTCSPGPHLPTPSASYTWAGHGENEQTCGSPAPELPQTTAAPSHPATTQGPAAPAVPSRTCHHEIPGMASKAGSTQVTERGEQHPPVTTPPGALPVDTPAGVCVCAYDSIVHVCIVYYCARAEVCICISVSTRGYICR